jgi:heparan sulfate N-deacetylase/N-sulfotransferase NDST2
MKAHNDSIAVNFSFYDVISLNVTVNQTVYEKMKKLRERCLDPGLYYKHFLNWLKHFSYKQFFLVDGDKLKHDPYETMIKYLKFFYLT